MQRRRGQIQLSFSMIFSIILIIATLAVAFYVIRNFIVTGDCVKIQLFYEALDKEVDEVWRSGSAKQVFKSGISGRVESVCFGDVRQLKNNYKKEYETLVKYSRLERNVFLFPGARACDSTLASYKLEHVEIKNAFCAPVKERKISVTLTKGSGEALVSVQP